MENICITGGAQGADTLFALYASKAGHRVFNYSFPNHGVHSKIGIKVDVVSGVEAKWDNYLDLTNEVVNRQISGMSLYSRNLLRRNMAIANDTVTCLYAVTYLDPEKDMMVKGGTAWAVYRAGALDIPVFLFDTGTEKWYEFGHFGYDFVLMDRLPPKPHGTYGAVGSRQLTPAGENAIISLYNMEN